MLFCALLHRTGNPRTRAKLSRGGWVGPHTVSQLPTPGLLHIEANYEAQMKIKMRSLLRLGRFADHGGADSGGEASSCLLFWMRVKRPLQFEISNNSHFAAFIQCLRSNRNH